MNWIEIKIAEKWPGVFKKHMFAAIEIAWLPLKWFQMISVSIYLEMYQTENVFVPENSNEFCIADSYCDLTHSPSQWQVNEFSP